MIDILLATYNGERYLSEQIDSILNQSYQNWRLLIRDDGSTDKTISIIEHYCTTYPQKIIKINGPSHNIGVISSFELLLKKSDSNYIMFCDQDDVWMPTKIALSVYKMRETERQHPNTPILIHTNLCIVDYNKTIIASDFWQYANIKPSLLVSDIHFMALCNPITGCTILLNQTAKIQITPFPKSIIMHDAWIGICIRKKGIIKSINEATIYYRQHGDNCVGATKYKFSLANKIYSLQKLYQRDKHIYDIYHPLIYKNYLSFLYHKTRLFYRIHVTK